MYIYSILVINKGKEISNSVNVITLTLDKYIYFVVNIIISY